MENKSPGGIAHLAYKACVMEASAEKPGNVTPSKGFKDMSYQDFIQAAERLEPFVERAAREGEDAGIGRIIYEATSETKNVNFGITIMFIPLAATRGRSVTKLFKSLTPRDTQWIVEAMRKGRLGGMELNDASLSKYDIFSKDVFKVIDDEGMTPLKLMEMAQPYDTLAKEWVEDYPLSRSIAKRIEPESIVEQFLFTLSEYPDTLIARKAGLGRAKEVSQMARWVLDGNLSVGEFDSYLRAEGNKLNPGTTADLIATGIFLKLMQNG